jgi:hypothetical protein
MGTVSAMDVATACMTPPMMTYPGDPPPDCSAAVTTGGSFQAWCNATSLQYLWIELDGAEATSSSPSSACSASPNPMITVQANGGVAGFLGGVMPSSTWFLSNTPTKIATGLPLSVYGTSGSGLVWLSGELQCGPVPMTSANVTLLGLAFTWKA